MAQMLQVTAVRQDRGMEWFYEKNTKNTNEAALILVSYGTVVYWIENEKVIAEKGDLLYIPPNQAYYGKCVPTVFHEKFVVTLSLSSAPVLPLLQRQTWVKSRIGMYDMLLARMKHLHAEWLEQAEYAPIIAQAVVTEWLAVWNREWNKGPAMADTNQQVERMKHYIFNHYREKITKEELGSYIQKSPNYAATLFRRVTGQTISTFVHDTRMKKAIYMLVDSMLTVGEVAEFVGYRDVSYFQRLFKRFTGRTPTFYMKERAKTQP